MAHQSIFFSTQNTLLKFLFYSCVIQSTVFEDQLEKHLKKCNVAKNRQVVSIFKNNVFLLQEEHNVPSVDPALVH